ncbi:antifreeze protein [Gymnopus androsaceus JB14]|uniref:Antifreeze protein n=1 Tax=Gymnopus androsaceus JB14 TaxID=1447944 RepID=A0A6A4GQQ6_9AGAR|nr:antifreeze protein [Gymnopus androsaceus JB14]
MFSILNVVCLSLWAFLGVAASTNLGPASVNLGTAANFAILAETGVSTVPQSSITGDVGLSPFGANNFTGFSLTLDSSGTFATSSQVTGHLLAASYTAPTPATLETAVSDMQAAYSDAASRVSPDFSELGGGAIGGLVLTPGLYKWTTGVSVGPADVTISGTSSDIFIFQIDGTLNITSQSSVTLAGGVLASNVIWVVAGVVTANPGTHVEGVILAQASVTLLTGATMNGNILAQNFVALQAVSVHIFIRLFLILLSLVGHPWCRRTC